MHAGPGGTLLCAIAYHLGAARALRVKLLPSDGLLLTPELLLVAKLMLWVAPSLPAMKAGPAQGYLCGAWCLAGEMKG